MDVAVQFPTTPRALKAVPIKLSRRMSAEQAFERIIAGCLSQVILNGEGVARFHDVECLHQMRVGLRRLRGHRLLCFVNRQWTPSETLDHCGKPKVRGDDRICLARSDTIQFPILPQGGQGFGDCFWLADGKEGAQVLTFAGAIDRIGFVIDVEANLATKEVGKGTGLGLSISKGIIEAHKGKFFYDHQSKNTRFVIDLPKYTEAS